MVRVVRERIRRPQCFSRKQLSNVHTTHTQNQQQKKALKQNQENKKERKGD
jgi:hypothetical protein